MFGLYITWYCRDDLLFNITQDVLVEPNVHADPFQSYTYVVQFVVVESVER